MCCKLQIVNKLQMGGGYPYRLFCRHSPYKHNCYITLKGDTPLGDGFVFVHGFSTIIICEAMGSNCKIYQQVTIGFNNGYPSIGDNVTVYPGAKIIGKIKIGDDVIIGCNAVVTKDVPSHSIVAGVPAKIIKRRSSYKSEWL